MVEMLKTNKNLKKLECGNCGVTSAGAALTSASLNSASCRSTSALSRRSRRERRIWRGEGHGEVETGTEAIGEGGVSWEVQRGSAWRGRVWHVAALAQTWCSLLTTPCRCVVGAQVHHKGEAKYGKCLQMLPSRHRHSDALALTPKKPENRRQLPWTQPTALRPDPMERG